MNFFKGPFVTRCKKTFEYIPLALLLTLMFIAESEMDQNLVKKSWNLVLTFLLLLLVYTLMIVFKVRNKAVIAVVVIVLWVIFIYIKNCIFTDSSA
jgi:glucan phosphoethanolaminetransferase (alkaline phosphatase superfamily)